MRFNETSIPDVYILENEAFLDRRGYFIKVFHKNSFRPSVSACDLREVFFSESHQGVIRGMHFQLPPADHSKIVSVVSGSIFDVILDLRTNSPEYGKHIANVLSRNNNKSIFIPCGCAHGFYSLTDSVVLYMTTAEYSKEHDTGIRWDSFGANWPNEGSVLSERDMAFIPFKNFKSPFVL